MVNLRPKKPILTANLDTNGPRIAAIKIITLNPKYYGN